MSNATNIASLSVVVELLFILYILLPWQYYAVRIPLSVWLVTDLLTASRKQAYNFPARHRSLCFVDIPSFWPYLQTDCNLEHPYYCRTSDCRHSHLIYHTAQRH